MKLSFSDKRLYKIKEKIEAGVRLDSEDGIILYKSNDLIGVGRLADMVRRKKHDRKAFYVYNQHINYTNICINRCLFCAYSRDKGENGAFTFSINDVRAKLLERIYEPVRELHVVGGLNPSLPFDYYIDLLKTIKEIRPNATIKAFTAVEIDYISRIAKLSLNETIVRLKNAGLSMTPGGGAEIMSSRVKKRLFPKKIDGKKWLEIMEKLHSAGIVSNATMLYGHIETIEERVDHLIKLRNLQDKTGGFSAFIPLAFHSKNTKLSQIPATTAFDDLKSLATARLMLDNFDHIKAYWVMIGEKLAQVALFFGADDLDGTIIEEKITHMAGAKSAKGLTREQIKHLISSAGFTPVERDSFYKPV
ncbi:MAG: aminofutalosine synthase MqnE [Thermodesulfobacteriota bacterium]|nr:aminofutalosine synthase MqnE [Thermodesulfobacteriota bacterium]